MDVVRAMVTQNGVTRRGHLVSCSHVSFTFVPREAVALQQNGFARRGNLVSCSISSPRIRLCFVNIRASGPSSLAAGSLPHPHRTLGEVSVQCHAAHGSSAAEWHCLM